MVLFVFHRLVHLDIEVVSELRQLLVQFLQLGWNSVSALRSEVGAVCQLSAGHELGELLIADALVHFLNEAEIFVQIAHEAGQFAALNVAGVLAVANDHAFRGALDGHPVQFALVLHVLF